MRLDQAVANVKHQAAIAIASLRMCSFIITFECVHYSVCLNLFQTKAVVMMVCVPLALDV